VWLNIIGIRTPGQPQQSSTALWLPHHFVETTSTEWDQLKKHIENSPIDELYFHVGPMNADGSLPPRITPPLSELSTRNLAWIGQLRSKIDLENQEVRAGIVQSALTLKAEGFDGVHINIEPIARTDHAFVELLEEMRAADPDLYISVATDEWQPHGITQQFAKLFNIDIESYWSTEQMQNVAEYADEITVMTYDTRLNDPKLYRAWVAIQTSHLSRLLPSSVELRIGLPVYEEGPSINPDVENLKNGLQGYHMGASNILTHRKNIAGIALYPYWEMQEDEWELLNEYAFDFTKWLQENR